MYDDDSLTKVRCFLLDMDGTFYLGEQLLEGAFPRFAIDQSQQDDRKRVLQGGELIKLIENDFRVGVPLDVDEDVDRVIEIADVRDFRDPLDSIVVDQVLDFFQHAVARLLVGDFGDDDSVAILLVLLDPGPRTEHHVAAPSEVAAAEAAAPTNHATGGKIGAGDQLHQLVDGDIGLVDDANQGVADFP